MTFSIGKFPSTSHAVQKDVFSIKPTTRCRKRTLYGKSLPDGPRLLKGTGQIEARVTSRTPGPGVPSLEEMREKLGRKFGTQ